jgi:cobalamin synthase
MWRVVSDAQRSTPSFEPRSLASSRRGARWATAGLFAWLVVLLLVAWFVASHSTVELALVVSLLVFVVSFGVLALLHRKLLGEESRHADRR